MRIASVEIHNWRSIRSTSLSCFDITMLIGKNNHGKSNILFGLLFFFGRIEPEGNDFFERSADICVQVSFADLGDEERGAFRRLMQGESLTITKTLRTNDLTTEWTAGGKPLDDDEVAALSAWLEHCIFVPASRQNPEAINHRGETPVFQLLRAMVSDLSGLPVDIDDDCPEFFCDAKQVRHNDDPLLSDLEHVLAQELTAWGAEIRLERTPGDTARIQLKTSIGITDGVDTARKGHGLQRALIFAILRTWASFLARPQYVHSGGDHYFILFEEPELFLHPQAQKELHFAFQQIAENGAQVMFSTHSSFFVDLSMYKSICVVHRKDAAEGTKVHQYLEDIFELNEDVRNFNMNYWINPDRGELFFAKKVILAEGPTEKVILPKLAKKAGIFHYEYTIIDCSGKSNMPMYITLLNKFRIPYVVAYDSDQHPYRSRHSREAARLHSQTIDDRIDPSLGRSVVFANDIEDELDLRETDKKNKPFTALQYIADPKFEMSDSLLDKLMQLYDD